MLQPVANAAEIVQTPVQTAEIVQAPVQTAEIVQALQPIARVLDSARLDSAFEPPSKPWTTRIKPSSRSSTAASSHDGENWPKGGPKGENWPKPLPSSDIGHWQVALAKSLANWLS